MTPSVTELRDSLSGDVLTSSDREFERARLCFNLLIDRRPAAIARCIDAEDVAAALAFGQAHGLEIAVRGGGHNPAGHCAVDDGLVIDLSRMRGVTVDPDARIAVSEGGATWLDFDAAVQAHGLVTPRRRGRLHRGHGPGPRRGDRAPDSPVRTDVRQRRGRGAGHPERRPGAHERR